MKIGSRHYKHSQSVVLPRDAISDSERLPALPNALKTATIVRVTSSSNMNYKKINVY
ncbi:hypothetical protein Plhal304r1_c008g0032991 [Plasmopara halstedii]